MRSPIALAAGAAVLALAAAGCGSSSSPSSSSPPSTRPSAPKASAAPAPAQARTQTQARTTTTPGRKGEVNPAGDIPDNQAYVPYAVPGRGITVKVPEGWGRVTSPSATVFTDKLNSIRIETKKASAPLTVASARQKEIPRLARTVPGFAPGPVTEVTRHAGKAIRIDYLASAAPNPVTGKKVADAVERYVFFHAGRDLVLTVSGPKGADNVDPWRIVTSSVRFTR